MVDLLNPNYRGSRGGVRIRYPGIYRSQFLDLISSFQDASCIRRTCASNLLLIALGLYLRFALLRV